MDIHTILEIINLGVAAEAVVGAGESTISQNM
jgi:hypothetical protein